METKDKKRYCEAFKLRVMEELRDGKWKSVAEVVQTYGLSETGVRYWMKRLGFEYLNGRIIYVKTTSEVDEIKRLKVEVRKLKERLAYEVLDHKIDEVALRIACRNLGTTPDESKKRRKDGKVHHYWSVVENVRVGRCVFQRRALYLGELNDSQHAEWQRAIEG